MRILYDKKGALHIVYAPEEEVYAMEQLLFLHDTGHISLRTIQEYLHFAKHGGSIPDNVHYLPHLLPPQGDP